MNYYDIILTAIILISVITNLILSIMKNKKIPNSVSLFLHCVPLLFSIIHYTLRGFNYLTLSFYIASLTILIMYLLRRFKIARFILTILALIITIAPSAFFLFMGAKNIKLIDLSYSSYVESFKVLHNEIKENYPLADHKEIDFDNKYQEYVEYFNKAQKDGSKEEYYTALLQYLKSYQDGHFATFSFDQYLGLVDHLPKKIFTKIVGGSYGFTLLQLDDGRFVASYVKEGSPASQAGIKQGTQILKWNDSDMNEAVSMVSILWNYKYESCANSDHIWKNKLSLITRAPEGDQANISFMDETGTTKNVTLTAENDNLDLIRNDMSTFYKSFDEESNLSSRIIDNTHGYILLKEMPSDENENYYNKFKQILSDYKTAKVKDIIIDARSNSGGSDDFGAHLLELLTDTKIFYLQELTYQRSTDKYTPYRDAIISNPKPIGLDIPIVILVNNQTISAGEGFVYNASKLPNVKVAGMTETNGSFGTIDNVYFMPNNYLVLFPQLACVDEAGNVMIDTDSNNNGGIKPDIKIPIDENAIKKLYTEKVDYELEYMINYLDK